MAPIHWRISALLLISAKIGISLTLPFIKTTKLPPKPIITLLKKDSIIWTTLSRGAKGRFLKNYITSWTIFVFYVDLLQILLSIVSLHLLNSEKLFLGSWKCRNFYSQCFIFLWVMDLRLRLDKLSNVMSNLCCGWFLLHNWSNTFIVCFLK